MILFIATTTDSSTKFETKWLYIGGIPIVVIIILLVLLIIFIWKRRQIHIHQHVKKQIVMELTLLEKQISTEERLKKHIKAKNVKINFSNILLKNDNYSIFSGKYSFYFFNLIF